MDRQGLATAIASEELHYVFDFALSPDGTLAALSVLEQGEVHLWVQDLVRGGQRKVTFEGRSVEPAWTPDGSQIVFRYTGSGPMGIYKVPSDGRTSPEPVLTPLGGAQVRQPSYSPDGQWLIFTAGAPLAIYGIRTADGDTARVTLVTGDTDINQGVVSPNGRWIAFTSSETGTTQIYVRPFPETGGAKHLVSRESGHSPKWSSDGSEIFYRSLSRDVMVAEVETSENFSSTTPGRLLTWDGGTEFTMNEYGIHPDGTRFLVSTLGPLSTQDGPGEEKGPDEVPRLVIIENFFRVLRERAGG